MPDQERYYAGLVAAHAEIPIQYYPYTLPDTLESSEHIAPEPGYLPNSNSITPEQLNGDSRVLSLGRGRRPTLTYPSRTFLWDLLRREEFGHFAYAVGQQWRMYGSFRRSMRSLPSGANGVDLLQRCSHAGSIRPLPSTMIWQRVQRTVMPGSESQDQRRGMAETAFWSNFFGHCDPGFTGQPVKMRFPYI